MSINTWTPDTELAKKTPATSQLDLGKYISMGGSDNIETLVGNLDKATIDALTPLMKQPLEFWQASVGDLSADKIVQLIRFFTLAEEKHSQLFAGKQSPVIALNKLLKLRQTPLSKEEILWIKAHTTNRFLPNGSVL